MIELREGVPSRSTDRVRQHRERLQLHRATVAAAAAKALAGDVLRDVFAVLDPVALDRLQWQLVDASVSSTGNAGPTKRKRLDAYFTKPPVAAAVTERVAELLTLQPRHILEPSAGKGAFVHCAHRTWSRSLITAVDVRVRRELRELHPEVRVVKQDFLKFREGRFGLILGNPPFRHAEAHIEHALSMLARNGLLAFVLRQNFAGSLERARGLWRRRGLFHEAVIAPRPSFLDRGNDLTEYALFVWKRGYTGKATKGRPIIWRELEELRLVEGHRVQRPQLERGAA